VNNRVAWGTIALTLAPGPEAAAMSGRARVPGQQTGRKEGGTTMAVKPIPDGYHTVTPYLAVEGASRLIDFVTSAFDGEVVERMARPDGTIGHAEVKIGDSLVMIGDATAQWKPTLATLYLYVKDVDATFARAIKAGGVSVMDPVNQFYGDRSGAVRDPAGNCWWIATHVEDVPPSELAKRAEAAFKKKG
jgi:uncharacterized glyoxalase superfamily protein PhnB